MKTMQELARYLVDAHASGLRFETLRLDRRKLSIAEAYTLQDHYVEQLADATNDAVVGYKIGLTSQVMQRMCGIDSPIHGRILGSRVHGSGCDLQPVRFGRLGLEFEIAVKLARDLDHIPDTVNGLADYVEAVCPAIELVDDRGAKYEELDAASLIGDNSWNAGVVLGQWVPTPQDLPERVGRVRLGGLQVDEGRVGDALGHPFASVHWLAMELATRGRKLTRGMIVMTGSIVKTRFPTEAEAYRYEVDGLGAVEIQILAPAQAA